MISAIQSREAVAAFTILRAGTAAILLIKTLSEWPAIQVIYGPNGVLPWAISDRAALSIFPKLSVMALGLANFDIAAETVVTTAFVVYTAALVMMLLRISFRLPVFCAWYLHLTFFAVSFKSVYGLDCFANIALFYCLIGPAGNWQSVFSDRAQATKLTLNRRAVVTSKAPGSAAYCSGVLLLLFQFNVCLVYASAAWAKSQGPEWWNGESIWRAVAQPQFAGAMPIFWLHHYPLVAQFAGIATILVEGGYPFAVWLPFLRRAWLIAIVLMHVSIATILGLGLFSGIMIVLNLAAFGLREVRLVALRIRMLCRPSKAFVQ